MTSILEDGIAFIGIPDMNGFPITRGCDTFSIRRPDNIIYCGHQFCFTQDTLIMRVSTIGKDMLPSAGMPYLDRPITSRGCNAAAATGG